MFSSMARASRRTAPAMLSGSPVVRTVNPTRGGRKNESGTTASGITGSRMLSLMASFRIPTTTNSVAENAGSSSAGVLTVIARPSGLSVPK
jgi:hypothetical protein